jgi:hypothetical protein
MMKHSIFLFAIALFIGACSTPATIKDPKYAADDALLEETHAEMQQRLDSATVHFAVFAERVKRAKPDDPAPRELERPSIWLGDLQSILESDVRFMAERKAARVQVQWPATRAIDCAAWLGELGAAVLK